jgi:methyl-accepting chemotaxis protein
MKAVLATLLLLALTTGCNQLDKATQETTEAVANLKQEAIETKASVEKTIDQVQKAKDSVESAVDATSQASADLKAIGE